MILLEGCAAGWGARRLCFGRGGGGGGGMASESDLGAVSSLFLFCGFVSGPFWGDIAEMESLLINDRCTKRSREVAEDNQGSMTER